MSHENSHFLRVAIFECFSLMTLMILLEQNFIRILVIFKSLFFHSDSFVNLIVNFFSFDQQFENFPILAMSAVANPNASQPEELCLVCQDISTGYHYGVSHSILNSLAH